MINQTLYAETAADFSSPARLSLHRFDKKNDKKKSLFHLLSFWETLK